MGKDARNRKQPLVVVPIIVFLAFFAISWGPIVWVVIAEVFPNRVRGVAVSLATMALWAANFLVAQTFPWVVETFRGGTYFLFSGICFLAFVFVFFFVRETKGKTLEDIERMWEHCADCEQRHALQQEKRPPQSTSHD